MMRIYSMSGMVPLHFWMLLHMKGDGYEAMLRHSADRRARER